RMSEQIGWGNTILVIIATAFIGASLLRRQGASILQQVQSSASQNQIPSDALAKGFMTFIGGVLLLTPGFLTDVFGLSLIFPLTQSFWKNYLMRQWKSGINSGRIHVVTQQGFGQRGGFGQQPPTQDPFQNRRMDSNVIDIDAVKSQTEDKKD
ncbi:MAG: FxsA family protein, partial [Bdellovibrionales bacterium]|nr:FxsA family protein [Bdellovibrionales bacterium]NQZ19680.1 FxsA family protein [Bdellovibrionales bacterium]